MTAKIRGHWPKGKRRNGDAGQWSRLRLRLTRVINDQYQRGRISQCALALAIGVSERSVRRWLSGEDRPSVESQQAIATWLTEVGK